MEANPMGHGQEACEADMRSLMAGRAFQLFHCCQFVLELLKNREHIDDAMSIVMGLSPKPVLHRVLLAAGFEWRHAVFNEWKVVREQFVELMLHKNPPIQWPNGGLAEFIRALLQEQLKQTDPAKLRPTQKRLMRLQRLLDLSDMEARVIVFFLAMESHKKLLNELTQPDLISLISISTGIMAHKLYSILRKDWKIVRLDILKIHDAEEIELNKDISDYLLNKTNSLFTHAYLRADKGKAYRPESFKLPEQTRAIVRALLKSEKPCNILLYGQAGTGKTEFARAMVRALNQPLFFVHYGLHTPYEKENRRHKLSCAAALISHRSGILAADEADSLLNTRYFLGESAKVVEKGWLNDFLDNSTAKIVWISNDISCVEESTLRRFDFALEFKPFTTAQREQAWHQLLETHPFQPHIPDSMVETFSKRYRVNVAGIASALKTVRKIVPGKRAGTETVGPVLKELLERHETVTGHRPRGALNLLAEQYDPEALNTDTAPQAILRSVENYAALRRAHDGEQRAGNMNLLFWGRPGAGKTEFAKFLADTFSMRLCHKRSSDLQNCWVGGTEKNIRDAFEEAQTDDAILLLDEADSFFINRQTAVRSWETSQTNELLTQMENFRGILICCTNLLEHLDPAVLRRFSWKVEFRPLTPEGKLRIYRKYAAPIPGELLDAESRRLSAIPDLTPGDIHAAWQKLRFTPASELTHEVFLHALESESAYKDGRGKPIGFRTDNQAD